MEPYSPHPRAATTTNQSCPSPFTRVRFAVCHFLEGFIRAFGIHSPTAFNQLTIQRVEGGFPFFRSGVFRCDAAYFVQEQHKPQHVPKKHPFLLLKSSGDNVFIEVALELEQLADDPYTARVNVVNAREIVLE
jgi:hypothetical protein